MNNLKLLEAIAELESQRKIIDNAIMHLRKAQDTLSGIAVSATSVVDGAAPTAVSSYVDEAVRALEASGSALHVNAIIDFIASARGERPPRASVESSLIRHIAKTKNPRVMKTGRSTYDLPDRVQPTLAQIAS